MIGRLLSVAVAAAFCVSVNAAKAQQFSALDWSGFYIGGNAGAAVGSSQPTTTVGQSGGYFVTTDPGQVASSGKGNLSRAGFTGGVQGGYGIQRGNALFGVEASANALTFNAGRSITTNYQSAPGSGFTINQSVKADWMITLRPRLGWVQDHWLGYVTGGLALTQVKFNSVFRDTFAPNAFSNGSTAKTAVGWTVGLGGEYALTQNWSLKAEYLYAYFGNVSSTSTVVSGTAPTTATLKHSADLTAHIAVVGFNYRFGSF
jgi:opacity protein-like surface antigen